MRAWWWWLLVWLVLLAGCRSSVPVQAQPDLGAGAQDIERANDERMTPTPEPQLAVLRGTLAVEGFTILDTEGLPAAEPGAVAQTTARLLDPGDDILAAVNPDPAGVYELSTAAPVTTGKFQVELRVQEDLDGDGTGGDQLIQTIPVTLRQGYTAELDLTLRRGVAEDVGPSTQLGPGEFAMAELSGQDAGGAHDEHYGVFFAENLVIYDLDRDGQLDLGADFAGEDVDNDGWVDPYEANFPGVYTMGGEDITGVVLSVNVAEQLMILHADEGPVVVYLDPFALIEPLAGGEEFLAPLPLDEELVGRQVVVLGYPVPGGFHALWVVVLE